MGEGGRHGEEVTSVMERAERCEDNSPSGEICKAGVLYEAWSVCCEGVLHCTQTVKVYSPTYSVFYSGKLKPSLLLISLLPFQVQVCFIGSNWTVLI